MSLPPEIQRLIDRFQDDEQRLLSSGRRSSYNETEARIHYINPLFVALGWDMDNTHGRHAAEGNPQMKTMLQRQIDATDGQIDALVYALYGLTEEEIGIVEAQT